LSGCGIVSARSDPPRGAAVVRALVLVACLVVLAISFAVAFAADGASAWIAGVVAAAAALATLVSAVRLLVTLSLLRHPPAAPRRGGNGAGPA
jgi:hypothetical protein